MIGLKKTSEPNLWLIGGCAVLIVVATEGIFLGYAQPKASPFKPMELACVDVTGKVAAQDNTLRYYRDGGTIVGTDEANNVYVYTPPQGWVCRFGEKP